MNTQRISQCLNMGVAGGILQQSEADEALLVLSDPNSDKDIMLTRHEAAAIVKMHPISLDRLAKKGKITKYKTTFGPRYRRSELMEKLTMPNVGLG